MSATRASEKRDAPPSGALEPKRVWLAVAAAWVFPGAGHVLLGRVRRGVLFGAMLWAGFAMGMAHDGRLALRDARQPFLTGLQVVANLGIGPADMIARWVVYGSVTYTLPNSSRSGANHPQAEIFRERTRSPLSIYGTAYLWTAGLMNLLLLFDVWDIGMGRKP
jgi:hypothetical protein